MVLNYCDIEKYELKLRNVNMKTYFDSIILDLVTKDWSHLSARDTTELLKLLTKITKNKFFNESTIQVILKNLPSCYYNSTDLADLIISLINSKYASSEDIRLIYTKFSDKSGMIAEAIAKNSSTPRDLLIELLYHEQYSVIAAIGKNQGPEAFELLRNPDFYIRVSYAQKLLKSYNKKYLL